MGRYKRWLGLINIQSAVLVLLLSFGLVQAALPPKFQNEKDLDVMLSYVKSHPEVLSGLQAIDLGMLTIYYGAGCRAEFTRKVVKRPKGWVGPAETLVLKRKSCPDAAKSVGLGDDTLGGITSRATDSCSSEVVMVKSEGCKVIPE